MALGSCGHRITHQLRPINMNGRSILAVTSPLSLRKEKEIGSSGVPGGGSRRFIVSHLISVACVR
jgi:hypothetical protein